MSYISFYVKYPEEANLWKQSTLVVARGLGGWADWGES